MTKVVHLIPFPIGTPLHGGQIRARETNKALKASGMVVETICIFDMEGYPTETSAVDLSREINSGRWTLDWKVRDFVTGASLAASPDRLDELYRLLSPDAQVIVVEEPWLALPVMRLKNSGRLSAKVLYNSYNVEAVAKASILRASGATIADDYIRLIADAEAEVVASADAITAVTQQDADHYRRLTTATVSVSPNGATQRNKAKLRGIQHHGIEPDVNYALFVASAHAPNVDGFRDLVVGAVPTLKNNERIVVAGSVCGPLFETATRGAMPYAFRDKVCLLGTVSNFGLDCLVTNASVVLLPISSGGGSNLKTAEAIISSKAIAGTHKAFRGYEDFIGASGVWIGDTQPAFSQAMRNAFERRGEYVREGAERVLWGATLSPIVSIVKEMTRGAV